MRIKRDIQREHLTRIEYDIIRSMCANDLNVSRTARDLNYHHNTICYHIEVIKKITGYDLKTFYGAVELIRLCK